MSCNRQVRICKCQEDNVANWLEVELPKKVKVNIQTCPNCLENSYDCMECLETESNSVFETVPQHRSNTIIVRNRQTAPRVIMQPPQTVIVRNEARPPLVIHQQPPNVIVRNDPPQPVYVQQPPPNVLVKETKQKFACTKHNNCNYYQKGR
ncbi:hypothetical protein BMR1_03g02550 [Babesia microti strain RI]|uniref:Uncharacterized protein n=1 Tax=Babesia microti (strain RI) TaxID=1133968 RepID=A0A0K3AN08_BABMR|nr:hypothetical protein BMR1_03g02550 [Babesia microti strain RI]CTQ41109.1 hypothetical protein BMR1_03g02550 [Babesia microti strain RI]|eukprot:XP_012649120.1 hypothetical protein BMR1_03g02550 [Babesia microti strain RI]